MLLTWFSAVNDTFVNWKFSYYEKEIKINFHSAYINQVKKNPDVMLHSFLKNILIHGLIK